MKLFSKSLSILLLASLFQSFSSVTPLSKAKDESLYPRGPPLKATAKIHSFRTTEKIDGTVTFEDQPTGGCKVTVDIYGLNQNRYGNQSHMYHIHMGRVDSVDCDAAGGHFNPTKIVSGKCNTTAHELCEIGDLAGKWGKLPPKHHAHAEFIDPSFSLAGHKENRIVGRSIVIHGTPENPKKPIACGPIFLNS
ncbi:hypothetical protein CROQUDRAFT_706658 [Cronartium quercuum f. sp. fusiforme G11]|uniref:Superoxide dismutase copper/zinc binding domain-containing protein n=1 Tax=Cronartium quercuum f. sp. fusiforme G11 TaxID=708437 RepID=A0A9P6NJQ5_9BASI|nr:hypothetical protein CROQUDRAFT_706658 [Cronartium quercuum f. sp. fusiforme G11]